MMFVSLQSDPGSVIYGQIMPFSPKFIIRLFVIIVFKVFHIGPSPCFLVTIAYYSFSIGSSSARRYIAHVSIDMRYQSRGWSLSRSREGGKLVGFALCCLEEVGLILGKGC